MDKENKISENQEDDSISIPVNDTEQAEKMNKKDKREEEVLKEEIGKKMEEVDALYKALNDKYTRLYAEYDNFRRRTLKEKTDLIKYAGEEVIISLLPVLDDMERAIAHHKEAENHEPLREGLEIICQKMKNILSSKGVAPMETEGATFDPELHDAVTKMDTGKETDTGKIIEVILKGYTLNGKVIRHAKVIVGS